MRDQAASLRSLANEALARIDKIASGEQRYGARIITVTSGKGGVGKTFCSVNLATLLAQAGDRVLLFDADLGLANVNVHLGLAPGRDLGQFARGEAAIRDIIVKAPSGLDVLSGGSSVPELYQASYGMVSSVLGKIQEISAEYDTIIIDTGAGLAATVQQILARSLEVVLVTTLEPTAITDAYAVLKYLSTDSRALRVDLIVNMSTERTALSTHRALESAAKSFLARPPRLRYLGFIPEDQAVKTSILSQQPVVSMFPRSRASKSLGQLASAFSARAVREQSMMSRAQETART